MVSSSTTARTPADAYERLVDWVKQGEGGHVGTVRVGTALDECERGLFASAPLRNDDVILRIPQTHVITSRRARKEPYVKSILEATERAGMTNDMPDTGSDNAALLLFLLCEMSKKESSFWVHWFNSLPPKFVTLLTMSEDDMENIFTDELDGTPALPFVHQLRSELQEMFDRWFVPFVLNGEHARLFDRQVCDYNGFLYAHAIMESRAFKLADRPDDILLAPLADMINHASDDDGVTTNPSNSGSIDEGNNDKEKGRRNTKIRGWTTNDTKQDDLIGLELLVSSRSSGGVQNGNELKISYGSLANWELLVHFGFALRHNVHDSIVVQVEAEENQDENDPNLAMKRMIALHLHASDSSTGYALSCGEPLPQQLLVGVRILHASADELDNAARRDYSTAISEKNERAVVDWLKTVINDMTPPSSHVEMELEGNGTIDKDTQRLVSYCRTYVKSIEDIVHKTKAQVEKLLN